MGRVMRPVSAARLSRFLVRCHPRRWRDRYGPEMLDVLDQHHATARTVASLWASAVSAQLDPAYRTDRLSLSRLRRGALISATVAAPLVLVFGSLFGYAAWKDSYWHPAADEPLETAAFSPHTGIMVTAFGGAIDGMDMVWDVTELSRPRRLSQFEGGQPLALSPDGRTVATVAFGGQAALWNVADPRRPAKIATLPGSDGNLMWGQAFSPDGRILATARYDKIFLWDLTSPARPRLLRTLDASVTSPPQVAVGNSNQVPFSPQDLAFSPGGNILASATGTDQVTLWNVTEPARAYRVATIDGPGDFIQAFAFSPRGNLLAAVTYHGTVLVYSLADPARPARTARVRGLLTRALYPSGSPQPTETPLCATCGPASYAVAFTPDGHTLTVVVDRAEMSASSGRDTIFDWPVTSAGTLGAGTAAARDVADFQPVIAPGDRTVLGSPPGSHTWHAWPLP
jgi:WD40 repeat protein